MTSVQIIFKLFYFNPTQNPKRCYYSETDLGVIRYSTLLDIFKTGDAPSGTV